MSELTAEDFAQRALDYELLDARQIDSVWSDLGTRDVALGAFQNVLLRRELMTNYQVERVIKGLRTGYFYGDYKVLYMVGTGTFARVFRTVHRTTGKVVAAKVLRRRFADDPKRAAQFVTEGELGMGLRHPNICPIYEVHSETSMHQAGTNYFLIIEFIEGQNLREMLRIRKKFSPIEATNLMIDIVSGLAYAAERGLTHRDLKLTNVLVSSKGRAKLVDFGLAAFAEQVQEDGAATNPRTVDYAGLEMATGAPRDDPRSDLFFAGAIYYSMLTGQLPLADTRDRALRLAADRYLKVKPIADVAPELPRSAASVAIKAMEPNPDRRYDSPASMLLDLKLALQKLEKGDNTQAGQIRTQLTGGMSGDAAMKKLEGLNKTVMIVEANPEMQNVLRERLKKYGYRVLVIGDPNRALGRFDEGGMPPADIVVFSAVDLGIDALEAFNAFGKNPHTRDFPAVLLVKSKHVELKEKAVFGERRKSMTMPIKVRELRNLIHILLQKTAQLQEGAEA